MKKVILLYGLVIAGLVLLLKWMEYGLLIRDLTIEVYIGVIALAFTAFGIWLGLKLTRPKMIIQKNGSFTLNEENLKASGISKREYDVLELMASGLSNKEIADKLFISENTVKTHISNIYIKLDSKRRTHAIQRAKELSLLP